MTEEERHLEDHRKREIAAQIACIGDTDGDGNCPLPGCMHCHPENFTELQLRQRLFQHQQRDHEQWPHRAVLVLVPAKDERGRVPYGGEWCLWREGETKEDTDAVLMSLPLQPIKDREYFMQRAGLIFDAYVEHMRSRGVELPEHQQT